MTLTVISSAPVTNQPDSALYYYTPLNTLTISDDQTQRVTVTVTEQDMLHSAPGTTSDVVTMLPATPFALNNSYQVYGPATNPPTVSGASITATGPLNPAPSTYNPYNGGTQNYEYSPLFSISSVKITPPGRALVGNQLLESDFTVNVTDTTGQSASTVVKYFYANPISATSPAADTSSHYLYEANNTPFQTIYVNNVNGGFGAFASNGFATANGPGTTTITVTQSSVMLADPTLSGGNQRIPISAGTLSFTPKYGDATNAPVANASTGLLVIHGSLTAPLTGVSDPVDYPSGYAPHEYSPATILSGLVFTPPSNIHLSGKQSVQTTFTILVTDDQTGSNKTATVTETFQNPVRLLNSLTSDLKVIVGSPVIPFGGTIFGAPSMMIATITQANYLHTNPGAANDQRVLVGPGTFNVMAAGSARVDTSSPSGLLQVTGNYTDVNNLLTRTTFTAPNVTLTGNQTLETDFQLIGSDLNGDFVSLNRVLTETAALTNQPSAGSGNPSSTTPSTPVSTTPSTPVTTAPITPIATTASVYRFFDSNSGTHFFTSSTDERNTLLATRPDLVQESNGFGAVDASAPNAVAVFRFFDTVHGTQFITSSTSERDTVHATRPDLTFEAGDLFYEHGAQLAGDVAVYRFFDTKLGTHFYTGNQSEHDAIATPGGAGYRADLVSEGVAFYAPTGLFK